MIIIAVLAQIATRKGDDIATSALGAGTNRVSHVDKSFRGGGLGAGGLNSGSDAGAHCECGV